MYRLLAFQELLCSMELLSYLVMSVLTSQPITFSLWKSNTMKTKSLLSLSVQIPKLGNFIFYFYVCHGGVPVSA